jgi:hypothetical protein
MSFISIGKNMYRSVEEEIIGLINAKFEILSTPAFAGVNLSPQKWGFQTISNYQNSNDNP